MPEPETFNQDSSYADRLYEDKVRLLKERFGLVERITALETALGEAVKLIESNKKQIATLNSRQLYPTDN